MPVFPVRQAPDAEGRFEIAPEDLRHLSRVLRLKPGDRFEVSLPDGGRAEACLEGEGRRRVGRILQRLASQPETRLPLWIGLGLIRFSRLEWLVEKATELGVERLSPLLLSRGRFKKSDEISENKINRLEKIAQETLKQCERIASIRIDPPMDLRSFLKLSGEDAARRKLLLEERSRALPLREAIGDAGAWAILVGPEGGLSPEEKSLARGAGFTPVSLGATVLRSETAALYAAAALDMFRQGREERP